MRRSRLIRAALVLAAALAALAVAAPFIRADRFRAQIVRALEEALNRRVEIAGPVRFRLLPLPGFSARNVVIHDDPSMGLEPLAYVDSLDVGVRLISLWRRRLDISALRLVEPSVNLVKNRHGLWNYPPLLDRAFGVTGGRGPALPQLQVRSGRLNFKFGDTKSVFYFAAADLDVSPAAGSSAVRIRFSGLPARTDQRYSAVGLLSGRGSLAWSGHGDRLDLNLHLERSAISEILRLLQGKSLGMGGFVTSTAHLEGPPSAIRVTGRIQMAGIPRGFLPLASDRWALDYTGGLDLAAQALHLESRPGGASEPPLWIRFRLNQYLRDPQWALGLTFRRLPVDSLPALAREAGLTFPQGLYLAGYASGAVTWSPSRGLRGQVAFDEGEAGWEEPKPERLRIPQARLLFDRDALRFTAPEIGLGRQTAAVDMVFSEAQSRFEARLDTDGLAVDEFLSVWSRLGGPSLPPLLSACAGGAFAGSLRYAGQIAGEAAWSGSFSLRQATVKLEGMQPALRIGEADVWLGRNLRVHFAAAHAGGISFTGDYGFEPRASRPHRLNLNAEVVDAARLERLFVPALRRSRRGLLARTLRLPPPAVPAWLSKLRVEGRLKTARLDAGPLRLHEVRARLFWDGPRIELPRVEARFHGAALTGRIEADLAGPVPRYRVQVGLGHLVWDGGLVSCDFGLETSGAGASLLQNLRAGGSFSAQSVMLAGRPWERASGCFELWTENALPHVRLSSVEVTAGARTYYGFGAAGPSGEGELLLFRDGEELRLSGPFFFRAPPAENGGRQQHSR